MFPFNGVTFDPYDRTKGTWFARMRTPRGTHTYTHTYTQFNEAYIHDRFFIFSRQLLVTPMTLVIIATYTAS